MSEKQEIPTGWAIVKIGDVFDFIGGGTPSKKVERYWNGTISWASVKDVKGDYLHKTEDKITKEGLKNSAANLSHPEDVILITRILPGRTIISKITSAINQDLKIIKPKFETRPEFIRHLFSFIERECIKLASGTTVLGISLNNLNEIFVPLPPLPEQQRIVAKIEELFSSLDKGIESLKTAQQQLKVYRQAVLKWAFEGKLTNKNIVDGELPAGWIKEMVKDISLVNPKLPFENIDDNLEVSFLPMKLVEAIINKINLTEFKKYKDVKKGFTPMTNGDLIFAKITPCMENGKIAVVHSLKNKIGFGSTEFHVFRCKKGYYNLYLFHYLVQERIRQEAERNMSGAVGQRRVPKKYLEELQIPIPPTIEEQHAIVAEIESRLSVCDKIEESIEQSLIESESLRQSILKKAFEGKLVPQDPNDEPASKLLERIKAEKVKTESKKKKGGCLENQNCL